MKNLLRKYKLEGAGINRKFRDQLIVDYHPLVRYVAQRIASRLPSNIDLEDLISAGTIGLMDAIEKFDISRDIKFKTYAEFRIRGSILDELRLQDWVPRSVRDQAKSLERMKSELEQRFGRSATEEEMAAALGLDLKSYHDVVGRVKSTMLVSFDEPEISVQEQDILIDIMETSKLKNPFYQLQSKGFKEKLIVMIDRLPDKLKLVLSLYYFEELNLKEIGKILEVTESRVSQMHTQALKKLKTNINSDIR